MVAESIPAILNERQIRVLWLLSTGHSRDGIMRETGDTRGSVDASCTRIFHLLEAGTAAHAVRIGLLNGHIGPFEDCGTLAAYRRHIKRGEPACPACKRGNRERLDSEAATRSGRARLSPAEIRLLEALDSGHTLERVASSWKVGGETVRRLAEAAYTALGAGGLPSHARREAALREARRRGILTPPRPRLRAPTASVRLTKTQVGILAALAAGADVEGAARRLGLRPGTCATRLSEAYRQLDVSWMARADRLPAALRRAGELGLLPETASP